MQLVWFATCPTGSNPLSSFGHNLFALQMPMAAAFLSDTFYAAKLFPLRNPFPGSYTTLDNLPWRHVMWQGESFEIPTAEFSRPPCNQKNLVLDSIKVGSRNPSAYWHSCCFNGQNLPFISFIFQRFEWGEAEVLHTAQMRLRSLTPPSRSLKLQLVSPIAEPLARSSEPLGQWCLQGLIFSHCKGMFWKPRGLKLPSDKMTRCDKVFWFCATGMFGWALFWKAFEFILWQSLGLNLTKEVRCKLWPWVSKARHAAGHKTV